MNSYDQWKKWHIYRIPAHKKAQIPGAYSPQLASIGPYHNGEPGLQAMEEHKARALQRFRGGISECYKALESKVDELISSYQSLGEEWTKGEARNKFLMLMVKDGVFLYEFMRGYPDGKGWKYDKQDPVFSVRGLRNIPNIVADILMLENQLPITVLERLIAVEEGKTNREYHEEVNKLVLKFLSAKPPTSSNMRQPLGLHVLDISRKVLAPQIQMAPLPSPSAQTQMAPLQPPSAPPSPSAQIPMAPLPPPSAQPSTSADIQTTPPPPPSAQPSSFVPIEIDPEPSPSAEIQEGSANEPDIKLDDVGVKPAMKLDDVGVKFTKNKILSFDKNKATLSLPPLTFDATTEPRFLNAIAFECLHPATNNEVSSYIAFLQELIASPSDVEFLRSKDLIQSKIGDDQAVDGLMKTISKNVLFDPSSDLCVLAHDLNKYYTDNMGKWRRRRREWWRTLRQSYFKNPWTIINVIAATVLLLLTALQTGYTMKQAM